MEILKKRFETFLNETMPIIDFYEERGQVRRFDGNREAPVVTNEVIEMLLEIKALQEVKVKETYREDKKRIKHLKKEVDRLLNSND